MSQDGASNGGLQLPALAPASVSALKQVLPAFAAVANPLDVTASLLTDPSLLRVTLEQLASDPNVGIPSLDEDTSAGGHVEVDLGVAEPRLPAGRLEPERLTRRTGAILCDLAAAWEGCASYPAR